MAAGFVLAAGSWLLAADDQPLRQTIDREVAAAWEREKITPAPFATDAEFVRRVSLDLVGMIPTYDETVAFLGDSSPDKRAQLIDRLLDDPRYAQQQADRWDLILFGRNPPGYDTDKRDGIQRWLREQFAANRPYDQWVRELLRAEGNSVEHGPPMYYLQYRNQPEDLNEVVTQTFLGVQLQCARCHDHPFEDWKQTEFYGMAAFFARLELVSVGKKDNVTMYAVGEKNTGDVLFTGPAKDQGPGKKGEPIKPKFLLGEPLVEPPLPEGYKEVKFEANKPPPPPLHSRKDQLADWIARPENPFFAKAITNRLWAQYLGHGLVHPIDNLSPANTPSHPALLDAMSKWLVEHKFDLKALTRELLNSQAYQLSGAGTTGEPLPVWFQHARSRPLSAEELAASWRVATGYEAAQQGKDSGKNPSRFRPLEGGYMLRFFGQPNNGVGDFQGGLAEHLYLNNGPLGSLIVTGPGSLLAEVTKADQPMEDRIDRLFLQMLNRPPHSDERTKLAELLTGDKPEDRWRDAVWSLMTCSEFRFNK
ncbi:MAG: DUF1549 domain-containing protein [Pirellulaceae bacterium]|nr:DUF1549 domain-containing protein [Pirellulaceae bacterium]